VREAMHGAVHNSFFQPVEGNNYDEYFGRAEAP
jgi:hypothetical protein